MKTAKVKILVAEDEVETLTIMAKRISEQGYQVLMAHDGEQALEQIRTQAPDIIILDLMMPKVDGFAVLKNLREHHVAESWQPVIIVSARKDVETFSEEFFSVSDLYIQKPCYMEDILKAIRFMLRIKDHGSEFGGLARDN